MGLTCSLLRSIFPPLPSFLREIYLPDPSFFREIFPPAPSFTVECVPDLSGKVALVTGANTGLGKETARVLLSKNAKVWIACRDMSKAEVALKELKVLTGRDAHFLKLDLSNLRSIKDSVEEFLRRETQLHILFNNAGILNPPIDALTDDGYDLQFGTNVLGHFYLTKLLLPVLASTAESSPEGNVRVVNISSMAHVLAQLQFDTFIDGPKRRAIASRLYAQSKMGNVVFSVELHRRYHDQGIVSTAISPGIVTTEITRHFGSISQRITACFMRDVSYGALTQLYAGTAPDAAGLGGQYLVPWARVGTASAASQDPQLGRELWTWMEEQVAKL